MSHIVHIKTQVRDQSAVRAACQRLGLAAPIEGTAKLYTSFATGLIVKLPNWTYPIVCDTVSGDVKYDNFQGRWGKQVEFDRFIQAYAVEVTKIQARKKGHSVTEQSLSDGSVKLTVTVNGGVA